MSEIFAGLSLETQRASCVIAQLEENESGRKGIPKIKIIAGHSITSDLRMFNKGWPDNMQLIRQMTESATSEALAAAQQAKEEVLPISKIYLSIHGSSFICEEGHIEKHFESPEKIEKETLKEIFDASLSSKLEEKGLKEEYEVLHTVPKKFYTKTSSSITSPLGMTMSSVFCDYIAAAVPEDVLDNIKDTISEPNIKIQGIYFTPLSVSHYLLSNMEKTSGTIMLDLGSMTTSMSLYKDGAMVYFVELNIGSDSITNDIREYINQFQETGNEFSFKQAAEIKDKYMAANPSFIPQDAKPIKTMNKEISMKELLDECVMLRLYELLEYLNKYLTAYLTTNGLTQDTFRQIVLTGGGSNMKGLKNLIKDYFKAESVRQAIVPPSSQIAAKVSIEIPENLEKMDYVAALAAINYAYNKPDQYDLYSWNDDSVSAKEGLDLTIGSIFNWFKGLFR